MQVPPARDVEPLTCFAMIFNHALANRLAALGFAFFSATIAYALGTAGLSNRCSQLTAPCPEVSGGRNRVSRKFLEDTHN